MPPKKIYAPAETIYVHKYEPHIWNSLYRRTCFLGGKSITSEFEERRSDVSEQYKECVISQKQLSGSRGLPAK